MNPISRLSRFSSRCSQTGFTLVELMVGMAIGLLATVVIIQVMSVFEAQRRTTSGSADAQTNGGIALHTIGREMQTAGYPLFPGVDSALECTTLTFGGTNIASISPVTITNGTTAAGDTITIRYGSSATGGAPSPITAMSGNDAEIGANIGCRVNDIVIITNGAICAMTSVTGPTDIAIPAVASSPAKLGTVTLANITNAIAGANVACLGVWNEVSYAVNAATGNLERTSIVANGAGSTTTTTPSVVGVVSLQAQYGISATASSNQVAQWVDASGGTWGATSTTPTVANRKLIKAVRLAVVARNDNKEPAAVTTACSSINTAAPTGLCAWEGDGTSPAPTIDLSAITDWARYRYRVFETIVPLRNMIWAKDTL